MSDFKHCKRCDTTKTTAAFWQLKDGRLHSYCKPCCLEYKRDGKVRQLAMKRLWAANDDDRKRAGMLFVPIGRAA